MPPSVSPLFVVQLPPNLARQFSETKSLKGSKAQIHIDVTMTSMTSSVEYRKLLKTVENSLNGAAPHLLSDPIQTWQEH